MSNTIQIKRSSTAAAIPTAGQLAVGELAVNLADRKLYTKDSGGSVVELGASQTSKIEAVSASVASNALTVTINPTKLDFRSAALSSGVVNTRTIATALSAVVPSGATLGTANATLSKVMILAIDNAGTVEVAVCNGTLALDESGLISTTALSDAADSASVVYSTTARTNVPFRVVGFVESTQATAGTWAAAPSKVQGIGGQVQASSSKGITTATAVTASGTAVDFTSIPSWVKRITVMFSGVSTNGTSPVQVRVGTSSGVLSSGYLGSVTSFASSTLASTLVSTGCQIEGGGINTAASARSGICELCLVSDNRFTMTGTMAYSNAGNTSVFAYSVPLSDTLDRVRITTVNGLDIFDGGGTINISYEG